ncbi:hypothetical protein FDZ71_02960 [bacterium]|nr:MAG: hypothetical protein FDZ71_02960 [bacterium]
MKCAKCGGELPSPPYFRNDECPSCRADLHACVQCLFYSAGSYNQCLENQAERVTDKEKGNLCDWFKPSGKGAATSGKDAAKAAFDSLFKK